MEENNLDIFSASKKKYIKKETEKKISSEKEKIIIDYREKNSLVASELCSIGFKENIEFSFLKVADYIVKDVAIERKTINDFISSMLNRRLVKQLEELQQYNNRLLIIEGINETALYLDEDDKEINEEYSKLNTNSIRGFLLSITLNYKVPVIFTKNEKDTAKYISLLSKRKKKEISLNVKKRNLTEKEQLQFIIESFPGIGPKTSKKLLEKFSSIKEIINASEEELEKIIGKKGKDMKEIIDRDY